MPRKTVFLAVTAALIALAADWNAAGERWWNHVRTLADDRFQGRDTGTEGYRKAAEYVVQEFERYGLKPSGASGYMQPVRFDVRQVIEDQSKLELLRGGRRQALQLGEDAVVGARSAGEVTAGLVFVGYGLKIPEAKYDDFAGLDLKGKIAVFYGGGPKSVPGPLRAHFSSAAERRKALRDAGAVGSAGIQRPDYDVPWARAALRRFQPSMTLAGDEDGLKLGLGVNPEHADKLFTGTGHTIAEIITADKEGKPLPRFPLQETIHSKVVVKRWSAQSDNIVALLPGSDPKLRGEYVVLTAHLDGLGFGPAINGDKIYNGAMDDASGVATLLEVARTLRESKTQLKRSLLFVVVTGEEKGLLGSKYFANHPAVNIRDIVADINVDMYLPLTPLKEIEVQGGNESTLGDAMRTVGKQAGVAVVDDREPERNLFIRSDQYNFILKGVPALAFKFGYEKGSPEEKIYKNWLKERYHAPSDDANQPVDKAAAAQFNDVILKLAVRTANAPERPRWRETSFFRRFAQ